MQSTASRVTGGIRMTTRHTRTERGRGATIDLFQVSHPSQCNGTHPAIRDLTLRIEPGELVALLAPRGCGNSALLRLIAGLEQSSSGMILLDGEPASAAPRLVLSRNPALPASKTVHAQVTAARNDRRGPGEATLHADQALRLLGLNRFAAACPRELTAGTAQRVSLATALVNDPSLLLLDDPFARLDPITRAAIQGDLVSLWHRIGFTALLATSDVDEALSVASRIIVLDAQSAHVAQDLTLDCDFPRRAGDPELARTRRLLLQSLEAAGTSQHTSSFALRHAGSFAPSDNFTRLIWPGPELAPRHAAAFA
jgi:NitT/TauT family transport system ATP-binding protein